MTNPTATIFLPYHALDDLIQRGTRAAQPDAADVTPGTLYCVTDEGAILERSTGATWEIYSPTPGGASTILEYRFATTTDPPPSNSQLKLDAAHPFTTAAHLYVHVSPADGSDAYWALMLIAPGQVVNIQDKTDHTKYVSLTVTGAPIDNAGVYVDLPVSWRANGTAISNQAVVLMRIAAAGGIAAHHATHEPGGSDALTALDASTLTTGTVPDARLSGNVALENVANVFTADQHLSSAVPRLVFTETDQPANQQRFDILVTNQVFGVYAKDDAAGNLSIPLQINRGGDTTLWRDLYEKGRSIPMGHWQTTPYAAADYSATSPMTWTVTSGNVFANRYTLIGKTMIWSVLIGGSTLGGSVGTSPLIRIPGGYAHSQQNPMSIPYCGDAAGDVRAFLRLYSTTMLEVVRNSGTWTLGTCGLQFTIALEID